ncbi:hypothetical protein AAFF_G00079250 [Aldrovandia affinis]|uniref:G-protein coupled receptors family 1 profile domain-containing protein n=1 Tax=Aldrovandia affinis TaxID=143900 RepID=A0AAD7RXJ2_9TELE|nr:hypothetical protein AAFF_G00079250 [Aldrovandia affinis]
MTKAMKMRYLTLEAVRASKRDANAVKTPTIKEERHRPSCMRCSSTVFRAFVALPLSEETDLAVTIIANLAGGVKGRRDPWGMRRPHRGANWLCGFQEVDPLMSTEPLPEGESSEAPGVVNGTAQEEEEEEEGLGDLFPMDQEATPGPAPMAGHFGTAQLEDPNLTCALHQVSVVDGRMMDGKHSMAKSISQYSNISNNPRPLFSRPLNEKIMLVQVLVGIFLYVNCLMIYTFFKKEAFRSDTRYILFAQTLFVDSPLMVLTDLALIGNYFQYKIPCIPCVIACMVMSCLTFGTPLTLMAMCLERYVAICMPLRHSDISTSRARLLGLVLICSIQPVVIISIFVATIPLSFYITSRVCSAELLIVRQWQGQLSAAISQLYFLVMSSTIVFTYIKIMKAAKVALADNKKSASKGLRTVVLHAIQLLLCLIQLWCPFTEMAVMEIDLRLFINWDAVMTRSDDVRGHEAP